MQSITPFLCSLHIILGQCTYDTKRQRGNLFLRPPSSSYEQNDNEASEFSRRTRLKCWIFNAYPQTRAFFFSDFLQNYTVKTSTYEIISFTTTRNIFSIELYFSNNSDVKSWVDIRIGFDNVVLIFIYWIYAYGDGILLFVSSNYLEILSQIFSKNSKKCIWIIAIDW